ncbi:MAG: ABC transporter substrate-binding protein [Candidatus Rokubacteria bacterium]|nr:ABC transporter substrate-binding protein [Candidatus Rokubacteria bacterium]
MNARTAVRALAVLVVTLGSVPAEPQAQEKAARALTGQASEPRDIGVLFAGTTTFLGEGGLMAGKPPAFSQRLRELGYVDGQDIAIRFLSAESQADRLPDLAKDLVDDGVSVIVAIGDQAVEAARRATKTIPIVMAPSRNPVRSGFVADLARPAGNITGLATSMPNSHATRLRTLKEIVPTMSRVAVIWNSGDPAHALALADLRAAASEMAGTTLHSVEVRRPTDLPRVVAALEPLRADALVVVGDPFTVPYRAWIVNVMTTSRLPAIFEERDFVEEGGLISHGPRHPDLWRRAADYVDRIPSWSSI